MYFLQSCRKRQALRAASLHILYHTFITPPPKKKIGGKFSHSHGFLCKVCYFRETLTKPDCGRQIWCSFPPQNFAKLHLVRGELESSISMQEGGRTDNMMKLKVVSLNYVHVRKNWAPSSRKTQSPLRRPRRWCSSEEWSLFTVRIHRNKRGYRIWGKLPALWMSQRVALRQRSGYSKCFRRTSLPATDWPSSWHKHNTCQEEVMTVSRVQV